MAWNNLERPPKHHAPSRIRGEGVPLLVMVTPRGIEPLFQP